LGQSHSVLPMPREQVDITDQTAVLHTLEDAAADVVLNCAGFLNVDRCEKEPERSHRVNGLGPVRLAKAIGLMKAAKKPLLFHFSTDFVFDGAKGAYREEDIARPLSYYGTHKIIADEFLLNCGLRDFYILRTASLLCNVEGRDNFAKRMLTLAAERPFLQIVDDLKVSMITIEVLAWFVEQMLEVRPESGLYNAVCGGITTWNAILRTVFNQLNVDKEIRAVSIDAMPNAALRPRNSDLDFSKITRTLNASAPLWENAVVDHVRANRESYAALYANAVKHASKESA
jgi:dTDP-4-dehydrorhamnose reductase